MNQIEIQHSVGLGEWDVYETASFKFSGGEIQAVIPHLPDHLTGDIQVIARLQSSDDIIHLLLINDLLDRDCQFGGSVNLLIPYMPYARQDRKMNRGEAFSLWTIGNLLESNLSVFDTITVLDPHSDVTPALFQRCRVIDQAEIIRDFFQLHPLLRSENTVVVSPDAGAYKKAVKVATAFGREVVTAMKVRDVSTGEITGTKIMEDVVGRDCLIVDDICDGGRTFTALASVLKKNGAKSVNLYVTHGIFSKGVSILFESGIDKIYTTNSFIPNTPLNLHTLDIKCIQSLWS